MTAVFTIICIAFGYVCGCFQSGYLFAKKEDGIDIRNYGSKNAGATNLLRVLGTKAGLIVFFLDVLKAFLPTFIVRIITGFFAPDASIYYAFATGFGAVLGHDFPVWMHFKGGKGVSCMAGTMLAISPVWAVLMFLLFCCIVYGTRYISLGSMCAVTGIGVVLTVMIFGGFRGLREELYLPFFIMVYGIVLLTIWQHRANIKRLLSGTENHFRFRTKGSYNEQKG